MVYGVVKRLNKPNNNDDNAAGTAAEAVTEEALFARLTAREFEMTTMKRGPAVDEAPGPVAKRGGVAEFLRRKAKSSSARSVALAEKFSEYYAVVVNDLGAATGTAEPDQH